LGSVVFGRLTFPLCAAVGSVVGPAMREVSSNAVLAVVGVVVRVDPRGEGARAHRPEVTLARRVSLLAWARAGRPRIEMARALASRTLAARTRSSLRTVRRTRFDERQVVMGLLRRASAYRLGDRRDHRGPLTKGAGSPWFYGALPVIVVVPVKSTSWLRSAAA